MTLESERLILRKGKQEDVDAITALASDVSISKYTQVPYPYERKHAEQYVAQVEEHWKQKTGAPFVITLKETGEIIGTIGFVKLDKEKGVAELGYWLGVPFRGNGYTVEAAQLLLQYGFNTLGLRRVYANVFTVNLASVPILKKLGFTREGMLRQTDVRDGEVLDEYIYGLLVDEYIQK